MKIKTDPKDFLKGRFLKTITALKVCLQEADSAKETKRGYTANAVYGRFEDIEKRLLNDIETLANDIGEDLMVDVIKYPPVPEVKEPEKPKEKIKTEVKSL
jgi:hypothetical protein